MTILEVESRTGLDRGTVRFYEAEGLIAPAREANGYRNYSEADIEKLNKIKLLRALDFSIDDIRAMDMDDGDFADRLAARSRSLDARMEDLGDAKRVIRRMLDDRAEYKTLNASLYLDSFHAPALPPRAAPTAPQPESEPHVSSPWRRYFARMVDFGIYRLIIDWVMMQGLRIPYSGSLGQLLIINFFLILITLAAEPLMLHLWGTTPGKALFGLSVTDGNGRKLTYLDALMRTQTVLSRGFGFFIPIYEIYRLWRSYKATDYTDGLPWVNEDAVLHLEDERPWRGFAFVGAQALAIFLAVLLVFSAQMPRHRGDLTPEEFAENVNDLLAYHGYDTLIYDSLLPDGTWQWGRSAHTDSAGSSSIPPMEFIVEGGVLTGTRYTIHSDDSYYFSHLTFLLRLSTLAAAYLGADPAVRVLSDDISNIMRAAMPYPLQDFTYTVGRSTMELHVMDNGTTLEFTMTRQ